jgi:hypothetical protein
MDEKKIAFKLYWKDEKEDYASMFMKFTYK